MIMLVAAGIFLVGLLTLLAALGSYDMKDFLNRGIIITVMGLILFILSVKMKIAENRYLRVASQKMAHAV
jgi:hypothetical protein